MYSTIPEWILHHAAASPDRLFAADETGSYTYKEALSRIADGVSRLREMGIHPGDRVLLECTQNKDFILALLVCHMSGSVFVPLEKRAAVTRIREIADDTEAVLLISDRDPAAGCAFLEISKLISGSVAADSSDASSVSDTSGTSCASGVSDTSGTSCASGVSGISDTTCTSGVSGISDTTCTSGVSDTSNTSCASGVSGTSDTTDSSAWESALRSSFPDLPGADDTAEILYTTGTTGASKGIEITHRNNLALAENVAFGTEMREGNVELIPLALSHSHGLRSVYANLFRGGSLIVTDGVSKVLSVYDMMRNYHATAMDLSPTAATVLLRLTRGRFSIFNEQLDYIEIGTAALPEDLKEELLRMFPDVRLYNFYGSTESGRSCLLNFNSSDNRKYCIGYPTRNSRFIVVDDERHEIVSSENHTGLLACAGPMNMKGYWKHPGLTEEALIGGVLYTKDEGYIDGEGRVYCLGRKDDVINYRGIKIAPEEIEEKAAPFSGITDCACIGLPDPSAGQIPVLCYTTKKAQLDETALMSFLAGQLEKERLPKRIIRCESIPRTPNGKIRRGELKEYAANL